MKRWLTLLVIVLVVGLVGFGTLRWASTPASTITSSVDNQDPRGVLSANSSVTPFENSYFTTQIPSDLQLKTSNENPAGAIMASYLFTNVKPATSDQVGITIGKMGLNRLSETSGVKQRLNDPGTYQQVVVKGAPEGVISFSKTDGYETAVFWQEGRSFVAVVVSGAPQRQSELDQILQTILSSWSWH